jgi:glucokinase
MLLGVEIGGTKLQVAAGHGHGQIEHLWRGVVDRAAGADGIRRQIAAAIATKRSTGELANLRGIGVGFGGPIDGVSRCTIKSHHVAGWDGYPLADWFEREFGCPCVIGNDADVAGLGEALAGAGRGFSPIFYMTIGSGIGGGLIVDRQIYRGAGKGAAEIGHLRMDQQGATLESLCSGWSIEQAASARWNRPWTCAELASAARSGDREVRAFLDDRWSFLAEAICSVIALVCPQRIIIGGGVSLMGEDALFDPLRQKVADRVFAPFADMTEIVPAALGEEVVLHGALALARAAEGT